MDASLPPAPIETLLAQRAWVRRLSRSLVLDGPSADDLEQQTWLAAMRSPPRDPTTARAWLGRVVRNLAMDSSRSRRRRGAHELAAARPESVRSTADVVAEADAHVRVVTAVHELGEPYRTTVLLRWFEDLPPSAVAQRMDVPVETVRTRLRRAHGMLRDALGARTGDAAGWIGALLPLTGLRLETVGASAAGGSASVAALGGAVMGTKTALALGFGAAVGVAFVGGVLVQSARGVAPDEDRLAEVAALRARIDTLESGAAARRGAPAAERRAPPEIEQRVSAQEVRIAEIEADLGRVRDDVGKIASGPAPRTARPDAAEPDLDEELRRLRALSDQDLLLEVRKLVGVSAQGQKLDGNALVRTADLFLARGTITDEQRVEALIHKGVGHRVRIAPDAPGEKEAALAAFRESADLARKGSREAVYAEKQIAWTASNLGEHREAAEAFLRMAADPTDTVSSRADNRFSAAQAFELARDPSRAVSELRGLIDEFGASEEARLVVDRAKAKLDEMAKRESQR